MPHLYGPDDTLDFLRIILFVISAYSVVILIKRYRQEYWSWNTKTVDIWYGFLMWSLCGCVFTFQAIALNRPLTPATVIMTTAILVTGKAVHKKGPWGGNAK